MSTPHQQVRGVLELAVAQRTLVVVEQHRTVVRVGTVLDDLRGALAWGQATQISDALLGDDNHAVVLGVVDVGDHRDDRRDGAPLAVDGDTKAEM